GDVPPLAGAGGGWCDGRLGSRRGIPLPCRGRAMKSRRGFWLLAAVTVLVSLAVLAVIVPGSPLYLANFFLWGGYHNGHPTRYWIEALDSPDTEVRLQAIQALGAIGTTAPESVPPPAHVLPHGPP